MHARSPSFGKNGQQQQTHETQLITESNIVLNVLDDTSQSMETLNDLRYRSNDQSQENDRNEAGQEALQTEIVQSPGRI